MRLQHLWQLPNVIFPNVKFYIKVKHHSDILTVITSIIKTYCGHKARFEHNINYLSLLKLHKRNLSFRKLFDALLNKGSSTVYQILKELLDDIALNARRSKPSNRDRVLLKDLPLLIWQIVNHPRPDRKVT